ncbi:MAG TPA: immunoglobulin domain-containing protein, partial [Opitutaceae bacterium]|nr:immunoglobulin domain-containing protein [Opitutaceae bacterium]
MRANSNRSGLLPALLMAVALGAPSTAPAYSLLAPVSLWPVGDVNWKENLVGNGTNIPIPSGGSPLQDGSTSWGQALQKAIDDLNVVLPDGVLTLSITQNSGIVAGEQNGVNNVAFAATVYGDAWGGSTVGISLSLWTGNRKIENDVLFNSTKTWNSYEGPQQNGITDLRRIALHEFGHSLGLDHPDQVGQVVTAIMNSVSSDIDELQQDDIDGLLSIYGAVMPVTITSHPQSYTTPVGGSWPFSVVATGSELITYDWEQSTNGGASWSDIGFPPHISSGSFSNLSINDNNLRIRVNVTNPAGTVASNVATLTVTPTEEAPVITAHPGNQGVNVGEDASFTVAASGSPTPTIQWESSSNGGSIWENVTDGFVLPSGPAYSGATTTTLQVVGATSGVSGRLYRALATNSASTATSNSATLTVADGPVAPSITTHPSNAAVNAGQPASFTVVASGTAPLGYQWRKGVVDIAGATSATFNIATVTVGDAGSYTVVVSNASGSVTSNAATLSVNVPPAITSHPTSLTAVLGSDVAFSVTASGTNPLSFQWRLNGGNITGATSA